MNTALRALLALLPTQAAELVTVARVQGSGPREVGAWMAVTPDTPEAQGLIGTIGGGHLEFEAIAHARQRLAQADLLPEERSYALGPSLGQCCGGRVTLRYERITAADTERLRSALRTPCQPVALFGGGHVGQALVRVLGELPFEVQWFDSRDAIFPADLPHNTVCEACDPIQAAVADVVPGSAVLIMSFSHAEDLDVLAACLRRVRAQNDLPYIGLIGSKTKWATFCHRLQARGFSPAELARVTCPIGIAGIHGKQPAVIAVAVAAQLLSLPGNTTYLAP